MTSRDGTSIAYDRQGSGPAVVLVTGGLDDGAENAPLATELAEHFTAYNYNRRGRGDSGDTEPYAVEREIEDIEALIEPFLLGDEASRLWREYVEKLAVALAEGRRGEAVERFMRLAGASEENIAVAKSSPMWPGLEAIAHTLAYDAACLGDGGPPTARYANIAQPVLVATGGGDEFFERAADALAASLPRAERRTLAGQGHVVDPKVMAAVLVEFFDT